MSDTVQRAVDREYPYGFITYEPRWTVHHMSEATRLELGLL